MPDERTCAPASCFARTAGQRVLLAQNAWCVDRFIVENDTCAPLSEDRSPWLSQSTARSISNSWWLVERKLRPRNKQSGPVTSPGGSERENNRLHTRHAEGWRGWLFKIAYRLIRFRSIQTARHPNSSFLNYRRSKHLSLNCQYFVQIVFDRTLEMEFLHLPVGFSISFVRLI
jgi:hypothetical protein